LWQRVDRCRFHKCRSARPRVDSGATTSRANGRCMDRDGGGTSGSSILSCNTTVSADVCTRGLITPAITRQRCWTCGQSAENRNWTTTHRSAGHEAAGCVATCRVARSACCPVRDTDVGQCCLVHVSHLILPFFARQRWLPSSATVEGHAWHNTSAVTVLCCVAHQVTPLPRGRPGPQTPIWFSQQLFTWMLQMSLASRGTPMAVSLFTQVQARHTSTHAIGQGECAKHSAAPPSTASLVATNTFGHRPPDTHASKKVCVESDLSQEFVLFCSAL
jgi:hypothetical protein